MIHIINNILANNGYKLINIELLFDIAQYFLFCPSDFNEREEYFLTIRLNIQSNEEARLLLEKYTEEIFEEIRCSGKVDSSFEKNCTMLICHEEDKICRETILAIEEDQYDFKKNVIAYTQQEFVALETYLAQEQIEKITNSVINNIITANSGQSFLDFKYNHIQQKNYYSVILKTALKLPFITYIPKKQQLSSLSHEIESSLSSNQTLIYSQLVNSNIDWDEENVYQQVESIWGSLV